MPFENKYFLSNSVTIEPLVNRWPAWSSVVAPVPASLHVNRYQLPMLRSFVQNPEIHAQASANPDLVGGSFMSIPASRVHEIQQLIQDTELIYKSHLKFATGLMDFQRLLLRQTSGLSLEPIYRQLPPELQGCVELVYDYSHRPSVRIIEPLMYRTELYNPRLQSFNLFALGADRSRPYFLNNPRLPETGAIAWKVPFSDSRVDALYRTDTEPASLDTIRELLDSSDTDILNMLFSADGQPPAQSYENLDIRITYFGHACVLIERNGQSVLTDPFISAIPTGGGVSRFSFQDLPAKIDYAMVTHTHQDHFSLETLLRLRHRIGCLVVPRCNAMLYGDVSLKLMAEQCGFKNVVELDTFDSLPLEDGSVTAVPFLGEHSDIAHSKTAYVVRMGCRQILLGADSDCLDENIYHRIRSALGTIDNIFIGLESEGAVMSFAYGSLLPNKPNREQENSRRQHGCNSARALRMIDALCASQVFIYAMGMEPWMFYVLGLTVDAEAPQWHESDSLLSILQDRGLSAERLYGKARFVLESDTSSIDARPVTSEAR